MRPASLLLLASLAGLFALELARGAPGNDAALLALGALPDQGGLHGQWWRLLSYAFLHWSWTHLLANAALLAWLGPVLERRVGSLRTLGLFLGAALVAGAAIVGKHALAPAPGVSVGASGAVFALLGAALWLVGKDPAAPRRAKAALALTLLVGSAVSLAPGVSLLGHAVGLAVGGAWALFARPPWRSRSPGTISPESTLRRSG